MKISYDYYDLINELKSDVEELECNLDDYIYIVRGECISHTHFITKDTAIYAPIEDYYFDFEKEDMAEETEPLQKTTIRKVLEEMEHYNQLI